MSHDDNDLILMDSSSKEDINLNYNMEDFDFSRNDETIEYIVEEVEYSNEDYSDNFEVEYLDDFTAENQEDLINNVFKYRQRNPRNYCAVKGCKSKRIDPGISLFMIPKIIKTSSNFIKKWMEALEMEYEEFNSDFRICQKHFSQENITFTVQGFKRLREFALPTKNLPMGNSENSTKKRKEIILQNGTVLKQVFPNKSNSKKILQSSQKKSKIIMKDGKILKPVKFKQKPKVMKSSEKEKSILVLEDGTMILKNPSESIDLNDSTNKEIYSEAVEGEHISLIYSENGVENVENKIDEHHFQYENGDTTIDTVQIVDNFTETNNDFPYFIEENSDEEFQKQTIPNNTLQTQSENSDVEIVENLNEESLSHLINFSKEIEELHQAHKKPTNVLTKDGKVLKPVKFKKKPNTLQNSLTEMRKPKVILKDGKVLKPVKFKRKEKPLQTLKELVESEEFFEVIQENSEELIQEEAEFDSSHLSENDVYTNIEYIQEFPISESEEMFEHIESIPVKNDCDVQDCKTMKGSGSDFISLPNRSRRYTQWLKILNLNPPYPDVLKVCLNHFKQSDILVNHVGKQRIHPLAVPCLKLGIVKEKIVTKDGTILKPVKFKKVSRPIG